MSQHATPRIPPFLPGTTMMNMALFLVTLLSDDMTLTSTLLKHPTITVDQPTEINETPVSWSPFGGIRVSCQRVTGRIQRGRQQNTLLIRTPPGTTKDTVHYVCSIVDAWCLSRLLDHGFNILLTLHNNHQLVFSAMSSANGIMSTLMAARAVLDNQHSDMFHVNERWDKCERMAQALSRMDDEQRGMTMLVVQSIPVLISLMAVSISIGSTAGAMPFLWIVTALSVVYSTALLYIAGVHPWKRYRFWKRHHRL